MAHTGQHEYELNGVKLQEVQQERDLDVADSSSLSHHCTSLGIIKRNFVMNDDEDFCLLFNCYVPPHLEYCMQVWSPCLKKDIECLEKMQRRAIKLVKGLRHESYSERLAVLRQTSLEKRKIRDLIQVFSRLKGFD